MDNIINEIKAEREYQIAKWGVEKDDTLNNPNDWVAYISHHSSRWFPGGFRPYSPEVLADFRKQMIKVATLAVAAIESHDRLNSER